MIKYLPLPKRPRGWSILSTIGRYSRPVIKSFLRMGKNIALKKLRGIAANKIKNGGEILTKLAPLRQGGLVQSAYKSEKVAKSFIPGSTQVGLRPHHIKKKLN